MLNGNIATLWTAIIEITFFIMNYIATLQQSTGYTKSHQHKQTSNFTYMLKND